MSLKYGIFCLLLSFIVLLLVLKNVDSWTHPLEFPPEKGTEKKGEKKPEAPSMVREPKDTTSIKSYILIAEKNIFHPERKEFPVLGGGYEEANRATSNCFVWGDHCRGLPSRLHCEFRQASYKRGEGVDDRKGGGENRRI